MAALDGSELPVLEAVPALRQALEQVRRTVLIAPPGAGKTTAIPLMLLDESWLTGQRIVMLEPRRLATRAAAARMAQLTGTSVGDLVGYQIRDDRRIGPATRIEVVTEGILTRRLQRDPELPGVGLVVFDEVHERNVFTDLGLALTVEVATTLRDDLRILAMSATVDGGLLAAYLGTAGNPAPVVESAGRAFPVDIRWVPAVRDRSRAARRRRPGPSGWDRDVEARLVRAVLGALDGDEGDVLAFLPGIAEIRRVERAINDAIAGRAVDVLPLAGSIARGDQDAALRPAAGGRRRVVLATDIAETSLTVEGVRIVVDSGYARAPRFDAATGLTRLETVSISRDSADQRAGRAGRTAPGVCYRLWSRIEHTSRPAQRVPEILAVDPAGVALELAAWGGAPPPLLDVPPRRAMEAARELLVELGAIDDAGITSVGVAISRLPVHPRLARMVIDHPSALSCVLAALLDERDVLRGRRDELPVDIANRVELVLGGVDDRADHAAVANVRRRAVDLARRLGLKIDLEVDVGAGELERCGETLLAAYPDRLAGRRRRGQFQLRTGQGAMVAADDQMADEEFLVAVDLDGHRTRPLIRLAAAVDGATIIHRLADRLVEERRLVWDDHRGDLVHELERRLDGLRLGVETSPAEPGPDTTAALLARVRATRLAALGWSPAAARLRRRIAFVAARRGDPWPDVGDGALLGSLDEWLAPQLAGARGAADLARIDLAAVLRGMLPWPLPAELDELAPDVLTLPGGRTVSIDYGDDHPTAAVRVQDLFGVKEHPRVLGGTVPVVVELLSPADRPIQITSDLPGFWTGSWAEVRKDMAGRYPKHRWPQDPANAPPGR